jgi:hypothetical protein
MSAPIVASCGCRGRCPARVALISAVKSAGGLEKGECRAACLGSSPARISTASAVVSLAAMARVDYRYELRRGEVVLATGHLSREQPVAVG